STPAPSASPTAPPSRQPRYRSRVVVMADPLGQLGSARPTAVLLAAVLLAAVGAGAGRSRGRGGRAAAAAPRRCPPPPPGTAEPRPRSPPCRAPCAGSWPGLGRRPRPRRTPGAGRRG